MVQADTAVRVALAAFVGLLLCACGEGEVSQLGGADLALSRHSHRPHDGGAVTDAGSEAFDGGATLDAGAAPDDAGATDMDAGVIAAPDAGTATASPWFNGDFETGNVNQWPDLHDSPDPAGRTVVTAPTAASSSRYAWRCVVGQALSSGTSTTGDSNFLANTFNWEHERPGQTTFYRFQVLFPSGTNAAYPGRFRPELGVWPDGNAGWNTILEWHEPAYNVAGQSPFPASPVLYFSNSEAPMLRWVGGARGSPTWLYKRLPVPTYDTWIEMVLEVKWSQWDDGYVKLWWNGQLIVAPSLGTDAYGNPWPASHPTMWRYDDGSYGPVWNQLGHYRRTLPSTQTPYDDTVYFDGYRAGPSLASVQ